MVAGNGRFGMVWSKTPQQLILINHITVMAKLVVTRLTLTQCFERRFSVGLTAGIAVAANLNSQPDKRNTLKARYGRVKSPVATGFLSSHRMISVAIGWQFPKMVRIVNKLFAMGNEFT